MMGKSRVDDNTLDAVEEALVESDMGVDTTLKIIDNLEDRVARDKFMSFDELVGLLRDEISRLIDDGAGTFDFTKKPYVILVVGVNGVGKTTSIGKLARNYKKAGKSVTIVAADTFRAAAADQLTVWADRAGVRIVRQNEGADAAAVVYDALQSAKSKGTQVTIIDTAGRLHNKVNLMEELKKIDRVIDREFPEAMRLNYIVLDATTGQNALSQVDLFNEAIDIDGIILTKLDGTAKGGVVLAIAGEEEVPVVYIGVGEGIDDLEPFDINDFVNEIVDGD